MSAWTKKELDSMMGDIVSELCPYMTEKRSMDYGQNGYPVNELVRQVMEDIKKEVSIILRENQMLRSGAKVASIDLDSLESINTLNL